MAHDKDKDHSHAENPSVGTEGRAPESAENSTEAIGAQQKKTKGKVRGVLGRIWTAFKDGVKKGMREAGYVPGVLEHPDDRAEGHAEEKHDKAHEPKAKKAEESKDPVNDDVQGEQGDTEATAGTDNDEAPVKTKVENNEPAKSGTKDAVPPAEGGEGKPTAKAKEKPAHDKNHDAHPKEEGMSTGTKVALGVAGTTVALGALATAGAVAVASEITQTTIEHGPKWLQTAGNLVKWPFRAGSKFLGNTLGEPLASAKEGFEYGREELVGHADYDELTGWTAPLKLVHNGWKSIWQNPVTRFVGGVAGGVVGFAGGVVSGVTQGAADAFSEENAPTWKVPLLRTKKPKEKKEKKPKKAKADAHAKPAEAEHAKPAEAEHAAHHRLAA